jgi:hypothetical protein
MRTTFLFSYLFFALTAGSFLFATTKCPSGSLRRRAQEGAVGGEAAGEIVIIPDETVMNDPRFENPQALNPELARFMIFTLFDTPEELEAKRQRYQAMARRHSRMSPPCLHKSFYGFIGMMNPALTEGMSEEEKSQMVLFYGSPDADEDEVEEGTGRKLLRWLGLSNNP